MSEPEKKSKLVKILAIVGCAFLVAIGGCVALVGGLAIFGISELETQIEGALESNPVIVEHIGVIESCDVNLTESGNAAGQNRFVVELVGSKGAGKVIAEFITNDAGAEELGPGVLRLEDGTEFDLGED